MDFRTEFSTHAVCSACDSLLVREGAKVDQIGKVAELQPDGSPLRLGTQGSHNGKAFELIGRIQVSFGDGYWNEWHILYSDSSTGWLGEAMGEYFINTKAKAGPGLPSASQLALGDALALDGETFVATGVVTSSVVSFEGELPFVVNSAEPYVTFDFRSASGRAATIDYSESPPLLFMGEYQKFPAFGFTGLRGEEDSGGSSLEQKTSTVAKAGVEKFNCPTCGAPHTVEGGVRSKVLVCEYCGSAVDIADSKLEVIWREESMREEVQQGITVPLGSEATIDGFHYKLIGFVKKCVTYEGVKYPWVEYLLYNREDGYRWLVESDGHFNLMETLEKLPTRGGQPIARPDQQAITYEGLSYRHFQSSTPEVTAVAGEFYWRVRIGEDATNFDYIAPPYMLSMEASQTGFVWSRGRYLTHPEVQSLFSLPARLRPAVGVAPNEPNPLEETHRSVWKTFWVASLVSLALLITGIVSGSGSKVFTSGPQTYKPFTKNIPQESKPFTLSGRGNLSFDFSGSMTNRWLFLDTQLVDTETKKVVPVGTTLQHYQGSGRSSSSVRVSGIPSGTYKLIWSVKSGTTSASGEIPDAAKAGANTELVSYTIDLRRGVRVWGWWWMLLLILVPIPLYITARRSSFETKRWYSSDHA